MRSCRAPQVAAPHRPLDAGELEQHLRDKFDLVEVQLTPFADGWPEGRGRSDREYRFEVLQSEEDRTVIARWERDKTFSGGAGHSTTNFHDRRLTYLFVVFVYLVWVGKIVRNQSRTDQLAGEVK